MTRPGGFKVWFGIGPLIAAVWRAILDAAPVKVWAQIGAAMISTVVLVGFGLVIWLGPWAIERQAQQLDWLGYGMLCAATFTVIALVAITGLSVNVRGGRDGIEAHLDQDDAAPLPPVVRTVTETTVSQPRSPAPPADDGELRPEDRVIR